MMSRKTAVAVVSLGMVAQLVGALTLLAQLGIVR